MTDETHKSSSIIALIAAFVVVSLNLVGAYVLKHAATFETISLLALFLVGVVISVNIGRFLLWGWMHRRIDLSKSYPLTAIFFPLVALLSVYNGENIRPIQWVGIAFITLGVFWFSVFVRNSTEA